VPILGGLVVGLLVQYLQAGARPHGVADVMEAAVLHGGRIPLKEGIVAGFGTIISIGSGASVGREGPAVYIGASFASWLGQTAQAQPLAGAYFARFWCGSGSLGII